MNEHTRRTIDFLVGIGIPCRQGSSDTSGFLDGVRIDSGTIVFAPSAPASNLLHEAGHLAILPGEYRRLAQTDVSKAQRQLLEEVGPRVLASGDPDTILGRVMMQTGDPEATAWAWAAGEALGLPGSVVIGDAEYDGEGGSIRLALKMRRYIGIHGLAHAGFCVTRGGDLERAYGLPAFPKLAMWLQKDVAELEPAALPPRVKPKRPAP